MQVQRLVVAASVVMMMACAAVAQPAADVSKMPTVAEQFADAKVVPPLLQGENAANAYMAAWDSVTADERVIMGNSEDDRQHSTLLQQQAYVERLMAAAMMDKCDWGLNYAGGLETLLPHLGLMRGSARVLAADATRLLQLEGTPEQKATHEREAMRRIKAIFGLSKHLREDRVLISSLVSAAVASLGRSWVEERVQAGTLSVDGAQTALGAMRSLQREDIYGMRASVDGEGAIMDNWLKAEYGGEDGPEKLADFIGTLQSEGTHPADAVIAKMNRTEFDKAVLQIRQFYADNAKIWMQEDAKAQVARLAEATANGQYGPVTARLAAVLDRAWTADDKLRREYGETQKLLEAYVVNDGKLPEVFKKAEDGQ